MRKKITIDRSKSDNGGSMTVRDMIFLTNLQIKMIIFKTIDEETSEQTIYQKIIPLHCIGRTHRNGKKFSIKERDLGK